MKEFIYIESEQEYNEVAKVLDKNREVWINGETYSKWSPYKNASSWCILKKKDKCFLDIGSGTWSGTWFDSRMSNDVPISAAEFIAKYSNAKKLTVKKTENLTLYLQELLKKYSGVFKR